MDVSWMESPMGRIFYHAKTWRAPRGFRDLFSMEYSKSADNTGIGLETSGFTSHFISRIAEQLEQHITLAIPNQPAKIQEPVWNPDGAVSYGMTIRD